MNTLRQSVATLDGFILLPWQVDSIFKLFEGNTSIVSENWRPFASSLQEKALCLAAIVK